MKFEILQISQNGKTFIELTVYEMASNTVTVVKRFYSKKAMFAFMQKVYTNYEKRLK